MDSVSVIEAWTTLKGETPVQLERYTEGRSLEKGGACSYWTEWSPNSYEFLLNVFR